MNASRIKAVKMLQDIFTETKCNFIKLHVEIKAKKMTWNINFAISIEHIPTLYVWVLTSMCKGMHLTLTLARELFNTTHITDIILYIPSQKMG